MNPVLFLDFDGPLFPDRVIHFQTSTTDYPGPSGLHPFVTYWKMDSTSVTMLNTLYAIMPFDTVVSSTWQDFHTKQQIVDLFAVNDLKLHLHDDWCTSLSLKEGARDRQVTCWLQDHDHPQHMCLDDPHSGCALDLDLMYNVDSKLQNVFLINPDSGIDLQTYKDMKTIVQQWANMRA